MKRTRIEKIILCIVTVLVLICIVGVAECSALDYTPGNREILSQRQDQLHEAAELLRELGIPEDDAAMRRLGEEWMTCQELKDATFEGTMWVTGYDIDCPHCQGQWINISASGETLVPGYSVAMCNQYPFGTKIYIEGLGIFEVHDRGVGPGHIDVACNTHEECNNLTGRYNVWILH